MRITGEISKIDSERRQVFGWAYVTHDRNGQVVVDKSGEFVDDVEELEKSAYRFVLNSRTGGADHGKTLTGQPIKKSTMIESVVFTPEKCRAMGIPEGILPQGAWWVGFQIEDDHTWARVKKGELTSFSIHGKGRKERVDA